MNNRLRELRKEKGLTQLELAKILNVSDRSVGFYETGERDPDTDTLKKLASFFSVSIDYLLNQSDIRNLSNAINESATSYNLNISELPQEAIKQVEDYIELMKLKYKSGENLK